MTDAPIPRRLRPAAPPQATPAAPPALPPALLPEVITDPTHEQRVRFAIRQFIEGQTPARIAHAIAATFGVSREQARLDVESMRDFAAREVDDETSIGFFMLRKVAQLEQLGEVLHADATAALSESDVDDEGNEQPISPQVLAMQRSARASSARAFVDVSKASIGIVARRSQRFGDKPVVQIQVGEGGITPEQAAFIKRLNGE